MALFDWLALLLLLVSLLMGLWRGLVFEVLSLAGWVAAFLCAQWLAGSLAAVLPFGEPEAPWRYGVAFALIFIVVAFIGGAIASMTRRLVSVAGLRPVDRSLGAVFGTARAAVVLLAVAVVVHVMAWQDQAWWRESAGAPFIDAALQSIKPALPQKLASYLP
ncbi:CvpA family protein [Pseudacidovorax intermedius]|uniref:Colicin V synthesis protein n=1 Tax=Pseudacidovorax intermedius TaxID=433924 RepID=A0A147GM18_9BURK|nr:CvpA family protein [Pseudacidovorax intermedius]KTT14651.1 colicin V synthesis protein [Pseudacidovorax intermedius]